MTLNVVSAHATDRPSPWARTWTGLAVLAIAIGVLYATIPYPRGADVVAGEVVTVDCASPLLGSWGSDDPPAEVQAGQTVRLDCPGEARERLLVGLVLVAVGVTGFVALRRRRGATRPTEPPAAPGGSNDVHLGDRSADPDRE